MNLAPADIVFETPDGGLFAVLPDVVVSESHKMGAVATEQEVELGVAITDHVRPERNRLSLEVVFSDTPLDALEGRDGEFWFGVTGDVRGADLTLPDRLVTTSLASASSPARGVEMERRGTPSAQAQIFQPDGAPLSRTLDSWSLLNDAKDGAWLATITTAIRTYESMVLLSAETTRTARDGSWIVVQLEFGQITQVATELVDAPVTAPRNRAQQNQGPQPDGEADEEQRQSLARQGLGLLGSIFGGDR